MIWLIGVVLALLALVLAGVLAFRLVRALKGLSRAVGTASESIAEGSAGLTVTPPPQRSADH